MDIKYIFGQMSEEERKSRIKYGDLDAMREFAKWYKEENS